MHNELADELASFDYNVANICKESRVMQLRSITK